MFILKADNRTAIDELNFSYLSNNFNSGVSSLTLTSTSGLSANDYVLLEYFGEEKAEIVQIDTVDSETSITLSSSTIFSHPETTKVSKIFYNQIKFYHTEEATFSDSNLLATIDIDPQNYYTSYEDSSNDTGFGWFRFYNSNSLQLSSQSNAIPYTDFASNTVQKIIEQFFNTLNNKEAKLISFDEAFHYLNEGYSELYNELNLANQEYTVPEPEVYTTVDGENEYDLPSDFSQVVSITDEAGERLDFVGIADSKRALENSIYNDTRYYLRGNKIGFVPSPSAGTKYYLYYNAIAGTLSSYYDRVKVPNNNFYCLHDYMMYKAAPKLQRSEGTSRYEMFQLKVKNMKINSIKRSDNKDSWAIAPEANV